MAIFFGRNTKVDAKKSIIVILLESSEKIHIQLTLSTPKPSF